MKKQALILITAASLLALSACSSVKQELGIGRNSPDEFMVVKRAPLSMPPDYDLRPPMAGSVPPPAEAEHQAKAALIGDAAQDSPAPQKQTADSELLQKLGADRANPEIRNVIAEENGYLALQNRTLVEKLIFDDSQDISKVPASTVNAKQEAERLKKNQEEGKPANEGDVPVIEKKQSTFDKIF